MKITFRQVIELAILFALCGTFCTAAFAKRDLEILGWVENAWMHDPEMKVKAKLDSGAETSSLDARIIKKFKKGGKRWVRFEVQDRETGESYILVRERVRTISVVQHDGSRQRRPVVSMKMCIAGRNLTAEVSLIDRSEFNYPMLLGRNALHDFALIDPGNTFLGGRECRYKLAGAAGNG